MNIKEKLKEQGRTISWLAKQLKMKYHVVCRKVNKNTFSPPEMEVIKKILS